MSNAAQKNSLALLEAGREVRSPKLSHIVAERVREQIVTGGLKPGDKLPPEGELLTVFKVSRPTLREAMRMLEADGLISINRGVRTGAVVLGASAAKATEYASLVFASEGVTLLDLHRARALFEPTIIASLAELSRDLTEPMTALSATVDQMAQDLAKADYRNLISGTNTFHAQIAKLSGIRTVAILFEMLRDMSDAVYVDVISKDAPRSPNVEDDMRKTVQGYRKLLSLLQAGEFQKAADFWRSYMERAGKFLASNRTGSSKVIFRRP